MKLHLAIEYATTWGEQVAVDVVLKRYKDKCTQERVLLKTSDGVHWHVEAFFPYKDIQSFTYSYLICEEERVVRREWNVVPRVFYCAGVEEFICPDHWMDTPQLAYMYSSAYIHARNLQPVGDANPVYFDKTILFKVQAPQLKPNEALALIGSQPPLGAWNHLMALRMLRAQTHEWTLSVSADRLYLPFEYKYVVIDEQTGELIRWETGDNRLSPSIVIESGRVLVVHDTQIHDTPVSWKTAGCVVPLFSLRS
ncbi:MAG: hypothetical protein HUK03_09395, partial [Bacteroidaceae bacterium]|nr:hypothetical protein [Bacteroidaceae bacterium]